MLHYSFSCFAYCQKVCFSNVCLPDAFNFIFPIFPQHQVMCDVNVEPDFHVWPDCASALFELNCGWLEKCEQSTSSSLAFQNCPKTCGLMILMNFIVCSNASLELQSFSASVPPSIQSSAVLPCIGGRTAGDVGLWFVGLSHMGS